MRVKQSFLGGIFLVLACASASLLAQQGEGKNQGQDPQQERVQSEIRENERLEYERRLREAGSEQERQRIRLEHQRRMQEQAGQKSNTPPAGPSGKKGHGGGGPKR